MAPAEMREKLGDAVGAERLYGQLSIAATPRRWRK
jgi:hypothetical protein